MREIRLKTLDAGPNGVRHPGIHTVPRDEAAALVNGGHAEYTTLHPVETETVGPQETETVEAPEKAAKRKGKK